ncbi:MAG: V-type ATPase subunit [Oscillospiraceae bacterium]
MAKKTQAERWLCVSAYVRALEARLLTAADYSRMIEANDTAEALRVLADHGYAVAEATQADLEEALRSAREELFADFAGFSMDERLPDLFRLRYDYHNAKVVLKSAAAGVSADRLLMEGGRVDKEELARIIREEEERLLPPIMEEAVREARTVISSTGDPRKGDFILDRACFAEMLKLAEALGSEYLVGYVRLMIDTENVKALLRVLRMCQGPELLAEAVLPGGTVDADTLLAAAQNGAMTEPYQGTAVAPAVERIAQAIHGGSVTAFEKACDDVLTHYLQGAALVSFGPEAVLAYIAAKEQELRNIRIIMSGRMAGLRAEKIRERMRESYV